MTDLAGQVVLITGAAERAGREFALRYARAGARVVINHVPGQETAAASVVAEIASTGGDAVAITADISDVCESQRLVRESIQAFGKLDILVHNASTFRPVPFLDVSEYDFEFAFGVNVRGPFFLSQAAGRAMVDQGSGRIIALLGNSLSEAWPDFIPHAVSKAALARLIEQLSVTLAPVVACNSVAPSQFFQSDDGVNDRLRVGRGESAIRVGTTEVAPRIRLRDADVDAVYDALLYFSTCPPQITGTQLRIDGGRALV